MASTRNKNTIENYRLEQSQYTNAFIRNVDVQVGVHEHTTLAGIGLLQPAIPRQIISNNAVDTESYLRGIGATNLLKPYEPPFTTQPNKLGYTNLYTPKQPIQYSLPSCDINRPLIFKST